LTETQFTVVNIHYWIEVSFLDRSFSQRNVNYSRVGLFWGFGFITDT